MFREWIGYDLVCDECYTVYEDTGVNAGYNDKDEILEYAKNDGWHEYNDKHYCSDCYDTVMEELDREIENTRLQEEHDYKQATR